MFGNRRDSKQSPPVIMFRVEFEFCTTLIATWLFWDATTCSQLKVNGVSLNMLLPSSGNFYYPLHADFSFALVLVSVDEGLRMLRTVRFEKIIRLCIPRNETLRSWECLKNAVFWDVTPCGSYENGCFGRKYYDHHQGGKNPGNTNALLLTRSVLQLLVTANVVPSSLILSIQLVFLRSVLQLLVTANDVPSSLILSI
jgi:hypothetical protein